MLYSITYFVIAVTSIRRDFCENKRNQLENSRLFSTTRCGRDFLSNSMRLDLDASSDEEGSPPPLSVREIAYDVFSRTYSYELLSGTHEWLEELILHFEITDEANIRDTFVHLALGCKAGELRNFPSKFDASS